MQILKINRLSMFVIGLFLLLMLPFMAEKVYADYTCTNGRVVATASGCSDNGGVAPSTASEPAKPSNGAGIPTSIEASPTPGSCKVSECNSIEDDLLKLINFLAIGVGLIVTISIVLAGLQYMTSRDNSQAVQSAKSRITNSVLAMAMFMVIYAFLQWLVPGGVFRS